jgi:hypothetical protein
MFGVPITGLSVEPRLPRTPSPTHRRRSLIHRTVLSILILSLSAWLVNASLAASSGPIERALMLLIAVLLPIHLVMWQLDGIKLLDRLPHWPRQLKGVVALIALAAGPMVLYPLGAIAVLVAIFSGGGAAAPALTVTGLLMLSPIFAIILVALMFALSRYKGG